MEATQGIFTPEFGFMANQSEINENMRAILIDWLIDVHLKFKLWPETLFLTINLLDRYAAKNNIKKSQLQLVGVSCMLIAAKYEEIYPPTLKDFTYITNNGFTSREILQMEQKILFAVDFDVKTHSPYRFLERYSKHAKLDKPAFFFAQYLLEIGLLDYRTLKYKPAIHACAAIYISLKLFKDPNPWPAQMVEHTGLSKEEIKPCAFDMCNLLHKIEASNVKAVFKKFKLPKFCEVSKLAQSK